MINDRGTKKWSSIMLPEHVEALKQVIAEQDYKEKPILDDQQKVEIDLKLQMAIQNDLMLKVEYFRSHDFHQVQGKLRTIDALNKRLQFNDGTELKLDDVLDVTIL